MRSLWRICKRQHRALDGEGARRAGGRWNSRGVPVVYASESLSLATLELFVHVQPFQVQSRAGLVVLEIRVPDDVVAEELRPSRLPANSRSYPAPFALQRLGDRWLQGGRSLLLKVPSAITPMEHNCLINPAHPDLRRLVVRPPVAFIADRRLAGR